MFVFNDYVLNGRPHGPVGNALGQVRYDPGLLRPYFDEKGRPCVTVNTGRMRWNEERQRMEPVYEKRLVQEVMNQGIYHPVLNATTLRKDEWIMLDTAVLRAARERLRAWADLAAANTFGGFDGMSRMILEHETMNDPGEAVVDMDGLSESQDTNVLFQLEGLPLPITHFDFSFSSRRLAVSRNGNTPLDTVKAEIAGRRVAEMIEKTLIGSVTGLTYGNSNDYGRSPTVYGYTNFPNRITKTDLTAPTDSGWKPETLLSEVLEMRQLLYNAKYYGPFMLYHSSDWDTYLDDDYVKGDPSAGVAGTNMTLRQRLAAIEGIQGVRRLDFFTDTFSLVMVQMTADVARAVIGMDLTTVQWETKGGMELHFKVMAIMVPQLRADYNGNCGIVHATTS